MTDPFNLPPKLVAPGIVESSITCTQDSAPSPTELRVGSAKTVQELLSDYAFHTPALLHLTVPLVFDPFDAFCDEYGKPVTRFTLRFGKPVFSGLVHPSGDALWNHTIFGLEREHHDAYLKWIGTCAFHDRQKGLLRRVRLQDLTIRDPLALENGLSPGPIPVTGLVIETNIGSFYYQTDLNWIPVATFDKSLVYGDTLKFTKALTDGNSDPYGQVNKE